MKFLRQLDILWLSFMRRLVVACTVQVIEYVNMNMDTTHAWPLSDQLLIVFSNSGNS